MRKQTKTQPEPAQTVYPVEATFDETAIMRGFNAFGGAKNLGAWADCEVLRLMIAGQYKDQMDDVTPGLVYRVITVFRHVPTNGVGLLANDITEHLLRDMELAGQPEIE